MAKKKKLKLLKSVKLIISLFFQLFAVLPQTTTRVYIILGRDNPTDDDIYLLFAGPHYCLDHITTAKEDILEKKVTVVLV